MKAWRVTNKVSKQYTESTIAVNIQREILNAYGITVKETDIRKVIEMSAGEKSFIGDLEITCKEAEE
jgi:hypothetical protein